jgi:hypothetical protein
MAEIKKKGKRLQLDEHGLTIGERELIEALVNGETCATAANSIVYKTLGTISWRLRSAKERHGCTSKEQLIYKLTKQGAI